MLRRVRAADRHMGRRRRGRSTTARGANTKTFKYRLGALGFEPEKRLNGISCIQSQLRSFNSVAKFHSFQTPSSPQCLTPEERAHYSNAWAEMESVLGRPAFHAVFDHMRELAAVRDPAVRDVAVLPYFTRKAGDPVAVKQVGGAGWWMGRDA